MSKTLYDTIESAKKDLLECLTADPTIDDNNELYDNISEIADGWVPVYNHDILVMAAEDSDLATYTPECGPAFDGTPTPINIIAANIYERIERELYEAYNEWKEAREDE